MCIIHGTSMIVWSLTAFLAHPEDLLIFEKLFADGISKYMGTFWGINALLCGLMEVWLVAKRFPSFPTLMLGAYFAGLWTWVAAVRPMAPPTGSLTINVAVVLVGILLVHRSGASDD